MRALVRVVLLALVLLVVAMISALTAMRFAIHRSEVEVPKLVGMTAAEAARAVEDIGLSVEVESNFYSTQIQEGRVVSQIPAPGSQVRRGWRVRTALSLGPQKIAIPDVVGQSARAADINLRRRGLEIGTVATVALAISSSSSSSATASEPDVVVAQAPPANASSVSAPRVSLLVSGAAQPVSYVMPSFLGGTLGSAAESLKNAGMKLGSVTVRPAAVEAGAPFSGAAAGSASAAMLPAAIVVRQSPAAGEPVVAGQSVSLEVQE